MDLGFTDAKILSKILKAKYEKNDNFTEKEIYDIIGEFLYNHEVYSNNKDKAGTPRYKRFIEYSINRMFSNFDTMILLTGPKGMGKSSFAMSLAMEYCKQITKYLKNNHNITVSNFKFNPNEHMAYTNAQVMERIKNLPPFSPLICDEAINFASSDDWAKSENKELVKKLGTIRTKHLFFILCWPLKMMNISQKYRNSYVNYWININKRGEGALFVKDLNPAKEVWNMKFFEKTPTYNEFTDPHKIEKIMKKHPNYWEMLKVSQLKEKDYQTYIKVREKNVYNNQDVFSKITSLDVTTAAFLLCINDLIIKNSPIGKKRLLLHIKDNYKVKLKTKDINYLLEDAKSLLEKINEVSV